MESHLEDDKSANAPDFNGATLQLDTGTARNGEEPGVGFAGPASGMGLSRDRPGSTIGRTSTVSTGSRTSLSQKITQTDYMAKCLFSKRNGAFEDGVEKAQTAVLKPELDGSVQGAYLLTEIDHWDNEREKVIVITDNSLLVINYDFIQMKVLNAKRIMMNAIDTIQIGDFTYPEKSLMQARDHGGVRIKWDKGNGTSFGQRWNPWCTDIPFLTFSHHPMIYHKNEGETVTYNVDEFFESLHQAVTKVYKEKNPGKSVTIVEEPIVIETYASLSSLIFNQSHLGFNRERGGISF